MKKPLSLLLVFAMCLAFNYTAFAATAQQEMAEGIIAPPEIMEGYLYNEDGSYEIICGYLVETPMIFSKQAGTYSSGEESCFATYEFILLAGNFSLTASGPDDAYASTIYLTINYTTQNAPTEYLLTSVSGYWGISDPQVFVTAASLTYGCNGSWPAPVSTQVQTRRISNNFSYNTGFTKYVTSSGVMGAYLELTYKMGSTRTWQFKFNNYAFGSGLP